MGKWALTTVAGDGQTGQHHRQLPAKVRHRDVLQRRQGDRHGHALDR